MMTVIGLMSGASLEGIDVALVATDGERRLERRHSLTFLTPQRARPPSRCHGGGPAHLGRRGGRGAFRSPVHRRGRAGARPACMPMPCAHFLETCALARDAVSLIGFHGLAVYQDHARGLAASLATPIVWHRLTGIDVVYDFARGRYRGWWQGGRVDGAGLSPRSGRGWRDRATARGGRRSVRRTTVHLYRRGRQSRPPSRSDPP